MPFVSRRNTEWKSISEKQPLQSTFAATPREHVYVHVPREISGRGKKSGSRKGIEDEGYDGAEGLR